MIYYMSDLVYFQYIYICKWIYIYVHIIVYTERDVVEGWFFNDVLKKPVKNIFGLYHEMLIVLIIFVAERKRVQGKMEVSCNISLKPIGQECASSTDCALAAVQLHAVKGQEDRDGWGKPWLVDDQYGIILPDTRGIGNPIRESVGCWHKQRRNDRGLPACCWWPHAAGRCGQKDPKVLHSCP